MSQEPALAEIRNRPQEFGKNGFFNGKAWLFHDSYSTAKGIQE